MEPQNNQPNGEQPESAAPMEANATPTTNSGTAAVSPGVPIQVNPEPVPVAPQQPAGEAASPDVPKPPVPVPDLASSQPVPAAPETPLPVSTVAPSTPSDTPQPGAVVSGAPSSAPRKRRWLLPTVIVAALLLLLGGGYIFAFYLPNTPGAVFATGMKRTGEGVDALVTYSNNYSKKGYKSNTFAATIHSTGTASFDGSLNGSADTDGNAAYKLSADVMGEKLSANIDSVHVDGSKTPDLYLQVTGVKKELDSFGLNSLDSVDGKWISIDHTLINSYVSQMNEQASGLAKGNLVPTRDQIYDAVNKMQAVNKQYIFATDAPKAVLANEKFIGKQTKDGRDTYHYTVSYDKANLRAYVGALGDALDSSSLNTWAKSSNSGKSLSRALDIQSLQKSIDHAKPGYKFDIWIDAKTKLVHAVAFADPSQPGTVFTLTQNYTGGTTYPFAIHVNGKDSTTGDMENASMDVALDTKNDSSKGEMTIDEGKDTHIKLNFTATPSKKSVQVKAPAGAEPVMNLLAEWGLSDSGSNSFF